MTASPKHLPPKWCYDERGSLLFDDITRLLGTDLDLSFAVNA